MPAMKPVNLAVVVPSYREGENLARLYQWLCDSALIDQAIIVDSTPDGAGLDLAMELAGRRHPCVEVLVKSTRGRAQQQNIGAERTTSTWLLFVHADTRLPDDAVDRIRLALSQGAHWGRFDVRLDASGWVYRMVEVMMNLRSRVSGICTGDQCLFISREAFEMVGGFPEQPLMEDVEISKRLKRTFGRPAIVRKPVITSARRWQTDGPFRTIALMWQLRFLYATGSTPDQLARRYSNTRGAP